MRRITLYGYQYISAVYNDVIIMEGQYTLWRRSTSLVFSQLLYRLNCLFRRL